MTIRLAAWCGLLWCSAWAMAAPADMPAGSTGLCKDGTYSTAAAKRGACRGHKGVQEWYTADAAVSATVPGGPKASSTSTTAAAPTAQPQTGITTTAQAAPAPAPAPVSTKSGATAKSGKSMTSVAAAAGGGPGMVWINAETKVYHCSGDRWYGKTKQGSYMTEADAKAQGGKPAHAKACAA